jgi:hypothetical protein
VDDEKEKDCFAERQCERCLRHGQELVQQTATMICLQAEWVCDDPAWEELRREGAVEKWAWREWKMFGNVP